MTSSDSTGNVNFLVNSTCINVNSLSSDGITLKFTAFYGDFFDSTMFYTTNYASNSTTKLKFVSKD